LAKIPFQIASRWDFRRKTRVFREKAAKNASSFEPVCTVTVPFPSAACKTEADHSSENYGTVFALYFDIFIFDIRRRPYGSSGRKNKDPY
ncbi:MAG: hypothetical protein U0L10_12000, partial [Lachnospiraceae bacterium]|nr:hypothetical protein [Lachnospiraceae bacterium]